MCDRFYIFSSTRFSDFNGTGTINKIRGKIITFRTLAGVRMKGLKVSLFLSLAIHLLLISTIYFFVRREPETSRILRFDLIRKIEEQPAPLDFSEESIESRQRPESIPESVEPTPPPRGTETKITFLDPIADFDTLYTLYFRHMDSLSSTDRESWKTFVRERLTEAVIDSLKLTASFRDSLKFEYSPEHVDIPVRAKDDIAEYIRRRNEGMSPYFLPPAVPSSGEKEIPPQFNFLPTEDQIHAMAELFKKNSGTQLELYSTLDTALPITAEMMDRNLDMLVEKGFVTRKKISPQNIFVIATPLFAFPIEMSRKNRLNPLYLYKPKVEKSKLLAYLQSRLFTMEDRLRESPADSSHLHPRIQQLQRMILTLIR